MTTNRKNTARSQEVVRGPYAPTAKPHLHLVDDTRKCSCGKEIVGNYRTCGQCNLLDQAKIHGQELFTCMICAAPTPFDFCWHCNRKPAGEKASARKAYDAKQPTSTPPVAKESEILDTVIIEACDTYDRLRVELCAEAQAKRASAMATVLVNNKGDVVTTMFVNDDGAVIEYRELNANEALPIRLVVAEVEEEEELEETRRAQAVREAEEAREAARMADVRSLLRKTCEKGGMDGLQALGADICTKTEIEVDGTKYTNPHFTARYQDVSCDFHDNVAAEELKEARIVHAKGLEMAAKDRREAEAAARRAKRAPKKDDPKPGKSGGSKNGKGNKSGGKGKK